MKALVVDDSEFMRNLVVSGLSGVGDVECVHASNGQEAVSATAKHQFDVILMDWNMPVMNGLEAVEAIRASGVSSPILMVTTEAEKARIIQALQAGATSYMIKPFKPEQIVEKVKEVIE